MICSNCGTQNEAGARFCIQCGMPQAVTCAVCGHGNPASARFCSNCGNPLQEGLAPVAQAPVAAQQGDAPPSPSTTPVAERRLVSVLFVDLVGSTTLSADRDPEETRELLSRYFDTARRTVEGHGGTIEKFIGDAVMAVWGAPTAHEDDAERAVRAALELVAAVSQIHDGDVQLKARAGVLTGEAAVTIGAVHQGMVAGDLVNTASRLQSVAPPGTVLVGEATFRAASGAISFEPAGEQVLKGKPAPVPAWRAMAVVARRGGGGRSSTLEPPFVGREDELQQLKDAFEATSRDRRPRLVTIMGQAGIGKSRLAWEFEKYLDGVVEEAFWHEGRSPAYGEGVSYWALAEMVRRRARITEGAEPGEARSKLAAMLEEHVTDPTDRRRVEPRLAGLLGLQELPQEGREELFSAWRTLFERIADRGPNVMVFFDLHWADMGLLDFIEDLLAWAKSSPIMVVALARPELLDRRPDWGRTVRSATQINLEPLADGDMRRLLEGLLPGVPGSALARIVERAEGIPLYGVETVRMLLDTGAVVQEGDRFAVRGDLQDLAVAETLQALIAARLDANLPEDRALLQDAAVLGLSFTVEALAAVAGTEPEGLAGQLDRLARRQLMVLDTDPQSPERGQYRFVQALLRDIAYQSLAREDRRARHLAAARYFEALGEDELAGVLANHYLDAFRSSRPGPEADALASQARISLLAAADRAAALHSYRQAIAYLGLALTVTTDPAEQGAIHERIARSAEPAGEVLGIEHARRAVATYRELGDGVGALRAGTLLGRSLISAQQESSAIETLEGVIEKAKPLGDVPELAAAHAELGRVYMLAERHEDAVAATDRALAVPRAHNNAVVEALITKGTSLGVLGRKIEAEAILWGAIHQADHFGFGAASLRARNNIYGPMTFANVDDALVMATEGFEMATRLGFRPFSHQFLVNLLDAGWRSGDLAAWEEQTQQAIENEDPSPYYLSGFESWIALRHALRGDVEAAFRRFDAVLEATQELESSQAVSFPHLVRGWLHLIAGNWEQAATEGLAAAENSNFSVDGWTTAAIAGAAGNRIDALEAVVAAFPATPFPGNITDALTEVAAAGLALRRGELEGADVGFARASSALEEHGDLLDANFARLLWGTLRGTANADAAEAGASARAFFDDRGADAFVRRFEEACVPIATTLPSTRERQRAPESVTRG